MYSSKDYISDVEFNEYYNKLLSYCSFQKLNYGYVNLIIHGYMRKSACDYTYYLINESISGNIEIVDNFYVHLIHIVFIGNIISYCGDITGIKLSKSSIKDLYGRVVDYINQNTIDLFNLSKNEELSVAFGVLTKTCDNREIVKYDDCLALLSELVSNSYIQQLVFKHYFTGNKETDKYILYTINFVIKDIISGRSRLQVTSSESVVLFATSVSQVVRMIEQKLNRVLYQDEVDDLIVNLATWKAKFKPGQVLSFEDIDKFIITLNSTNSNMNVDKAQPSTPVDIDVVNFAIRNQLCRGLIHSSDIDSIKHKLKDFWDCNGVRYSIDRDVEAISMIYRLVLDFVSSKDKEEVYNKIVSIVLG